MLSKRNVSPNSPPVLGGVAAPPGEWSRSLLAQTEWYGMARSRVMDARVALIPIGALREYLFGGFASGSTPPRLIQEGSFLQQPPQNVQTADGAEAQRPQAD